MIPSKLAIELLVLDSLPVSSQLASVMAVEPKFWIETLMLAILFQNVVVLSYLKNM